MGLFGISEDHLQKYQSLDERLIKNKASTFFFEATGSAMWPLIFHKDILVVDRSLNPQPGDVVVANFEGELLCRIFQRSQEGRVSLRAYGSLAQPLNSKPLSDQPQSKEIVLRKGQDLEVFGKVISIIRDLKNPNLMEDLNG